MQLAKKNLIEIQYSQSFTYKILIKYNKQCIIFSFQNWVNDNIHSMNT